MTFDIPIIEDMKPEENESFKLNIVNGSLPHRVTCYICNATVTSKLLAS